VISAAGTAITLVAWIWKTDVTVPIVPLVIVATLVSVMLATSVHAATVAHAAAIKRLPAVRLATTTSARGVLGILLLDASDLFVIDAEQEPTLAKILANDKTVLGGLIVKPHMPMSLAAYFGDYP
jgi:hypothetical protein